jgi:uncharacterized protein DUF5343
VSEDREETAQAPRARRTRAGRMARPPEAPVGDIDNLFERIRTIAPPTHVDAAWANGFGLKDAVAVLKWIGLVEGGNGDHSGRVDADLWNRVRLPGTRQEALAQLVRSSYAPIFDQVDVSEATREDLDGAFVTKYNLGDSRRYVRAFLNLCGHAGIEAAAGRAAIPAPATVGNLAPTSAPKPAHRPAARAAANASAPPPEAPRTQPFSRNDPVRVGVAANVEIPAGWTEEQIRARLKMVKRVVEDIDRR